MSRDLAQRPRGNVETVIQERIHEIAQAFPQKNTERFRAQLFNVLTTAIYRNQQLLQCDPNSIVVAATQAGALGLDLNPHLGEAYLVPRWNSTIKANECCFQPGYQGLVKLVRRTKQIDAIQARIVYDGDVFTYEYTPDLVFVHRPAMKQKGVVKNGIGVKAVYAFAKLTNGEQMIEVMTVADVESIRERSKSKDNGPWVTDWCEMAKKTVLRRLIKMLPKGDGGDAEALVKALEISDSDFESRDQKQIQNDSGFGSGRYCSPEQAKEYKEAIERYIASRDEAFERRWTRDDGEIAQGVGPLSNAWAADVYLVKQMISLGYLDQGIEADMMKARQVGRYTGICWHRSPKEQKAIKFALRDYLDEKERQLEEAVADLNPDFFGTPAEDDPFADMEGVTDIAQAITPPAPKPETLPADSKKAGKKTQISIPAEDDTEAWEPGRE